MMYSSMSESYVLTVGSFPTETVTDTSNFVAYRETYCPFYGIYPNRDKCISAVLDQVYNGVFPKMITQQELVFLNYHIKAKLEDFNHCLVQYTGKFIKNHTIDTALPYEVYFINKVKSPLAFET